MGSLSRETAQTTLKIKTSSRGEGVGDGQNFWLRASWPQNETCSTVTLNAATTRCAQYDGDTVGEHFVGFSEPCLSDRRLISCLHGPE
jgi:hypothetical protein